MSGKKGFAVTLPARKTHKALLLIVGLVIVMGVGAGLYFKQKSKAEEPAYKNSLLRESQSLYEQGKNDEAKKILNDFIGSGKGTDEQQLLAKTYLADILETEGKTKEALALREQLITDNTGSAALEAIAANHEQSGNAAKAIEFYEKALKAAESEPDTHSKNGYVNYLKIKITNLKSKQ
jgi:tetratricopeptide (TPR) repeat protein